MDEWKPSAYTPFARWFTDERARDDESLRALYRRLAERFKRSPYCRDDAVAEVAGPIWRQVGDIPETCADAFAEALYKIVEGERHIFSLPEARLDRLNIKEAADLRHFLHRKEYFFEHEVRARELIAESLANVFSGIARLLPQSQAPSPFTIPLVYSLSDADILDNVIGTFGQERYCDDGVYVELFRRLWLNVCEVSGIADPYDPKKPIKPPNKSGLVLNERVEAYFKGTPFRDLFLSPIPLKFTCEERFSHMHVLGGSGAGKTTLLKNLILNDVNDPDQPSLVVVDSQGDLIRSLSRLRSNRRVILISPKDIEHPPALNIFDVKRLGNYSKAEKEQVVAGVIDTFDYLFTGLLGADLTAKQSVFFRFVARLMLALPETMGRNATILDMLALMDDAKPYLEAIQSLPPIQRNFFERDFLDPKNSAFKQTREQIRYRLNAILENPTLARLFTTEETKIDLFEELNAGSVILVDTAKDFLKSGSSHFGRIFISLVLQAVLERAAIPEEERHPAFLVVDEAAEYFDSNIDDLLTAARKYRCGCVFSHQFLDQASSQLRASLAANTAIKFASGISMSDARIMAAEMRTTANFILNQPKLHFAARIRNITPNAVSIPVEAGRLEQEQMLTASEYREYLAWNRRIVSVAPSARKLDYDRAGTTRGEGATTARTVTQTDEKKPASNPGTDAADEW